MQGNGNAQQIDSDHNFKFLENKTLSTHFAHVVALIQLALCRQLLSQLSR